MLEREKNQRADGSDKGWMAKVAKSELIWTTMRTLDYTFSANQFTPMHTVSFRIFSTQTKLPVETNLIRRIWWNRDAQVSHSIYLQ